MGDHALQPGRVQDEEEGVAWGQPVFDESTAESTGEDYSRVRFAGAPQGITGVGARVPRGRNQAGDCPSTRAGPGYS